MISNRMSNLLGSFVATRDGRFVYVAGNQSGVIDAAVIEVIGTMPVGARLLAMRPLQRQKAMLTDDS